ncbi:RRXRR domain-containing protein [Caminibacter sp.]
MKVAVYSKDGVWMSYTHPARARKLLKKNKATIYRYIPFAIKINKKGVKMFVSLGNSTVNLDKVERIELKENRIMFFLESMTARENWKFDDEQKAKEVYDELRTLISAKIFK